MYAQLYRAVSRSRSSAGSALTRAAQRGSRCQDRPGRPASAPQSPGEGKDAPAQPQRCPFHPAGEPARNALQRHSPTRTQTQPTWGWSAGSSCCSRRTASTSTGTSRNAKNPATYGVLTATIRQSSYSTCQSGTHSDLQTQLLGSCFRGISSGLCPLVSSFLEHSASGSLPQSQGHWVASFCRSEQGRIKDCGRAAGHRLPFPAGSEVPERGRLFERRAGAAEFTRSGVTKGALSAGGQPERARQEPSVQGESGTRAGLETQLTKIPTASIKLRFSLM